MIVKGLTSEINVQASLGGRKFISAFVKSAWDAMFGYGREVWNRDNKAHAFQTKIPSADKYLESFGPSVSQEFSISSAYVCFFTILTLRDEFRSPATDSAGLGEQGIYRNCF